MPEQCVFDHVHNASRCWSYDEWNATAATACSTRDLKLRSFAILLPCGVDLFSGVEFVCCPRAATLDDVAPVTKSIKSDVKDEDDDDEEDEDDDDDDDDDDVEDEDDTAATPVEDKVEDKEEKKIKSIDVNDDDDDYDEDDENDVDSAEDDDAATTSTTTTTTTTTKPKPSPTPDPYLTHYNPKKERDDFLDAEQRLEERHRERVTKVTVECLFVAPFRLLIHLDFLFQIMKDWSELEDRYQDLHATDAKGAEEFKHKMTNR